MSIVILGIDLGKNSRGIVGLDANGSVKVRRRMRSDLIDRKDALKFHPLVGG